MNVPAVTVTTIRQLSNPTTQLAFYNTASSSYAE